MVAEFAENVLVIRRIYQARPKLVFELWTTPEYMHRWFRPTREYKHQFIEVDLQVGGRYHIAFESEEGKVDVLGGEFLEVNAPKKLVYTWTWEEPNENAGIETLVTVEFLDNADGTELVLTHERFTKSEMKAHHMLGWTGALDQLEEAVIQK